MKITESRFQCTLILFSYYFINFNNIFLARNTISNFNFCLHFFLVLSVNRDICVITIGAFRINKLKTTVLFQQGSYNPVQPNYWTLRAQIEIYFFSVTPTCPHVNTNMWKFRRGGIHLWWKGYDATMILLGPTAAAKDFHLHRQCMALVDIWQKLHCLNYCCSKSKLYVHVSSTLALTCQTTRFIILYSVL